MSGTIRLATLSDAARIATIYRPSVTEAVISFEAEPPDEAVMGERMRSTLAILPAAQSVHGLIRI